jgi:rod shape-determining protein MreC
MGDKLKKSHYIILIFVVVLVVVLLNLPAPTVSKLKLAVSGLFLPLFGLAASTHDVTGKAGDALITRKQLLRANEALRASNAVLMIQARQTEAIWRENEQLRQMLNLPRQKPWKLHAAQVIAREPTSYWRSVWIDLGSRDGVQTNCAVLTPEGLVGKVQSVGATRSQVLLLGDPGLQVSVIDETNKETGVLMSASSNPRENNMVDLEYLAATTKVRPGDKIETWGVGGVFSAGIPVGRVVDIRTKDNGLSTEGRVQLFADVGALEEVWVILP